MTNFENFKNMSVDEMAQAINNGISSDSCDYCPYTEELCDGTPCLHKEDSEIIAEWLESEVEE